MQDEPIILETGADPVGSVIWLHGLGADGHDFEPIVPELKLPESLPLRFVFPHAPVQPVTINGGMAMRAWFDIKSLDKHGAADGPGIDKSCDTLDALIASETDRGVPLNRILLAGFSQGGVIALHTALRMEEAVAGVMGLSTHLPLVDRVANYPTKTGLPILIAHGSLDPVLPLALGRESFDVLTQHGYAPEWHEYPMAHSVCAEEIVDIREFLLRVFEAQDGS